MTGCAKDPPPFDPAVFRQPEINSASQVKPAPKLALPTTQPDPDLDKKASADPTTAPATGPAIGIEPVIRMPLRQAVQRAVANNLDVKVQGYEPAIEETRTVEEQARFDPTFFTTAQYEHRDDTRGGSTIFSDITGGQRADIYTLRSGIRQNLPAGGTAELRYQTQHDKIQSDASIFSAGSTERFYESEVALEVTQPLLRDFGTDINRARISIQRNNQRISLLDFRNQVEKTIMEVEQTYWELTQAMAQVRIQEQLLDDTIGTSRLLIARKGNDVTRVQISQATGAVESRRADLIRARADVRNSSDKLKQLMNDPSLPITSNTLILPADDPSQEQLSFDLQDSIRTALDYRLELGQQQLRIDSATVARRVAKRNLLPQLNVVTQLAIGGLDDDYWNAVEDMADGGNVSYALGLQLEIPIGNRAARAAFRRSQLQQNQAIVNYSALINQISIDVKQKLREVETQWQSIVATRRAVFANEDALLAIKQREEAQEPLTPEFVNRKLDQQDRLAAARRAAATAIASYNFSISQLEQSKGTLLRYNNVVLEEDPLNPRRVR
jgi:outer membrane protein TolC